MLLLASCGCDLTAAVFCAEVLLLARGGGGGWGLLGAGGALVWPSVSAPLEAAVRMASLHRRRITSDQDTGMEMTLGPT